MGLKKRKLKMCWKKIIVWPASRGICEIDFGACLMYRD
jgi:hypothetical protein